MKALVFWCRWHDARLLLQGRSAEAVWGEVALPEGHQKFYFELKTDRLTLGEGENRRTVQLDEMGVEQGT